jgi:hypothetical protein
VATKAEIDAALKQYGYLGSLANSVPELKKLLTNAITGKWSNDEFSRQLQDSRWWKSQADSVKQNQILQATKPGEWTQKRDSLVGKTRMLAAELGVSLGEGHDGQLAHVVNAAMAGGWDEARLRQELGSYWKFVRGKEAGGTAGQITQKLRSQFASYGIQYSPDSVANATKRILTGHSTLESYQAQALQAAKGKYAAFADQLDQGLTMHDIAEPYRQSMSTLLEIPPEKVDMYDTTIQKALTARMPGATTGSQTAGKASAPGAMPLWQFEQTLRADPRRDKTKGAVNETYDALANIGQSWGFR